MKFLGWGSRKHFILALIVLQSACTPVRPDHLAQPDKSHLGRVGIAVGRFDPQYKFEALTGGKGEGAAKGALAGAVTCGELGKGQANAFTVLAMIVCLPVASIVGAVSGASAVESSKNIATADSDIQARLASFAGQEPLRAALGHYAEEVGLKLSTLPSELGPVKRGDIPTYSGSANGVDTVLEVTAIDLIARTSGAKDLPVGLQLRATVRVVNARDGTVIDSFPVASTPSWRPLADWLADEAKPVQTGINMAIREVAETAIDEVVLLYHPNKLVASHEKSLVPGYALRPIDPPLRNKVEFLNPTWGHLERFQLDSLTPTFEWEEFPRGFDITIGDGVGQAQEVQYDFRIYAETDIAYERSGLAKPKHRVEVPLKACHGYRWTVRARFRLNGSARATEWTGAFSTMGGEAAPWWWRRGSKPALALSPTNVAYYPIILTPGDGDQRCNDRSNPKSDAKTGKRNGVLGPRVFQT